MFMHKKIYSLLFCLTIAFVSCQESMSEEEIATIGRTKNKKPAAFIQKIGFNPNQSAFSSAVQQMKGIVLLQAVPSFKDSFLKYQHPTWSQYGWMGSITSDDNGNLYTAPIPFVNSLDNGLSTINTIYKIDHQTGEMNVFFKLPAPDSVAGVIPFGVMGLYYDSHGNKLYVSSIAGSTSDEEKGVIYALDIENKSIADKITGIDAMGLFVGGNTGEKKLYLGRCRSSEIQCVKLNKSGSFVSKPVMEINLDQLGPRGNDKARRIRYDNNGNLVVYGIDFNYSLAANSDKIETVYKFVYNPTDKKWMNTEIH